MKVRYLLFLCALACTAANAQVMDFEKYNPTPTLVVPGKPVEKSKFPFIDVHNHQRSMSEEYLKTLTTTMDALNMRMMVNLSGGSGDKLKNDVEQIKNHQPGRVIVFANINFDGIGKDNWTENAVNQLKADVKNGAQGLKIFKNLGLSVKDVAGKMVAVDDPRLDAIWATCGQLGIPVLIHTADPKPFWDAPDEKNERWLELRTHPRRQRSNTDPAPWDSLIAGQHRAFARHKKTTFIAAHFGWYPNDLTHLGNLMDKMPNIVVEFGAIIAELGRQPRAAKAFFTRYQDRILFGKDSWVPEEYGTYFRVLETEDEYFPYHKKYHAFWPMYGIGLSDAILKKVYYKNALRIIPGLSAVGFPQ